MDIGDAVDEYLTAVDDLDWTDGVYHAGAEAGTQTQLTVLPTAGVFAVVLTNTDGNDEEASQKIMRTVLEKMPASCKGAEKKTCTCHTCARTRTHEACLPAPRGGVRALLGTCAQACRTAMYTQTSKVNRRSTLTACAPYLPNRAKHGFFFGSHRICRLQC